jgi:hypothetical protein
VYNAQMHLRPPAYLQSRMQKRLIPKLERRGQMAAHPDAPDLLTAMLAGWDASWAHRRALVPRED